MPAIPSKIRVRHIVDLADRIEADIEHRQLKPGSQYLNTAGVAKLMGVEVAAANRALQLLAHRGKLARHRGRGTFIAEPPSTQPATALHLVHILGSDRQRSLQVILEFGELAGLQRELPNAKIQIGAVPSDREEEYLNELISKTLKSRSKEAFVLLDSTIAMQRILGSSTLPVVAQGTLHPSLPRLPFVDSDHAQVGEVAADYLLSQGFRRLLIFVRPQWSPGMQWTVDAIRARAHAAGLSLEQFRLRYLPADAEVARTIIDEELCGTPGPLGVIAMTKESGDEVVQASRSRGIRLGVDLAVVTTDFPLPADSLPHYPFIRRALSAVEAGAALGRLVLRAATDGAAATPSVTIPVELHVPKQLYGSE